jgi:hypothetical protein
MKKLYTLILASGFAMSAMAQAPRVANNTYSFSPKSLKVSTFESISRAAGDTLMLFDGEGFYLANATDANDFDLENFDGDGNTIHPNFAPQWPNTDGEAFVYAFFSTAPHMQIPAAGTDTNFFIGAHSWFDPPGKADNWWSFGPITIPAAGATFSWYHKIIDPDYSDGYKVFISTTGVTPYTDVDPSTDTPIFTKPDSNNGVADTAWTLKNVNLNNYAGQRIYIHFNHDANDKFVLYLDQMVVRETPASVNENTSLSSSLNAYPNPASNVVTFSYALASESNVTINITDITGKVVATINEGTKATGSYTTQFNTAALSAGTYFYSVLTNNGTATKKLVVTK